MSKNRSPWIHQLERTRPVIELRTDSAADVAVVGGGIAGAATAFFILRDTTYTVALVEGYKVAHGATGHNAGQITSYLERSFAGLAQEFGLEQAVDGQRSIEDAWELLDLMYTEAKLDLPLTRFIGFDGLSTYEQVVSRLEDNLCRREGGLAPQRICIAEELQKDYLIPEKYKGLYVYVPRNDIAEHLETKRTDFIAYVEQQKGVMNSALFTEEVIGYLLATYPDRFTVYEHSRVGKVVLKSDRAILDVGRACLEAAQVVLCTNGFENLEIFNTDGLAINTSFHHMIDGVVARMSGYLETMNKPPMALSYYLSPGAHFDDMDEPYFYLTRRPYEYEHNGHNLVCLGGPQHTLPDRAEYVFDYEYPEEYSPESDTFLRALYDLGANKKIDYIFSWHGLMGYTPNRIRRIGPEPRNPVLLYNLGCNGVGILPSIFGGKRIVDFMNGTKMPPSIFDPVA
jgi:glycine/D-amino acid oxidase-like deaminating enzyme